jgi:plastocyanin
MKNHWLSRIAAIGGVLSLTAAPSFAQTTHVVDAVGFSFVPQDITIQAGDTVQWINLAGDFHNVVETDCPATAASSGNSGISSGTAGTVDTFSLVFNDPGTLCYICEPHVPLGMFGSVTVQPAAGVPTMGEWGLITMSVLLLGFGAYQLRRRSALATVGS